MFIDWLLLTAVKLWELPFLLAQPRNADPELQWKLINLCIADFFNGENNSLKWNNQIITVILKNPKQPFYLAF